jgi:hypothetical protein
MANRMLQTFKFKSISETSSEVENVSHLSILDPFPKSRRNPFVNSSVRALVDIFLSTHEADFSQDRPLCQTYLT